MNIIWIIILVLEMVKYLSFSYVFFQVKFKKVWVIGAFILLYIALCIGKIIDGENFTYFNIIFSSALSGIIKDKTLNGKIVHMGKCLFLFVCTDTAINKILSILISDFRELGDTQYIIVNVVIIMITLIVYLIKKNSKGKYVFARNKAFNVFIYICSIGIGISMLFTIACLEYAGEKLKNARFLEQTKIISIVFLLSILLLLLFMFYVNDMNKEMRRYLEIEKKMKEAQKEYYEAMLSKEEDTRRYRHDMINHLMCLRELMNQERKQDALQYVEDLEQNMVRIQKQCHTVGNIVIDAVLNHYIQQLDESVHFCVTGNCKEDISISQMDLCTIFSNLLKNAVEELQRQRTEEKYLKVMIRTEMEELQIEVINSSVEKIEINKEKGLPKTGKRDKRNHGVGLMNVKDSVEQNRGIFQWEKREREFRATVILPMEIEKKGKN